MIVKKMHDGSILITDIYKGYWTSQRYYYYSIKEAKQRFKARYSEGSTIND